MPPQAKSAVSEDGMQKYGEWAFLIGLALVIIVGLASDVAPIAANLGLIYVFLAIAGLIVGFLNISEKEVNSFLIAAIALLGVSTVKDGLKPITDLMPVLGIILTNLLTAIGIFVAPAALVVAVKAIYELAREK